MVRQIEQVDDTWRFEVKADEVNQFNVHYPDIWVGLCINVSRFEFYTHPEYKQTALKRRLSHESLHYRKVQLSRPKMMLDKVAGRCHNSDIYVRRAILAERLVKGGLSKDLVASF